ncbi:MAG: hypothetical protein DI536_29400 [Archangium gephyra]|uniref:Uncharacterized protein n=1 Tax=Archangium gephyra TaxID=48 RepID=A0A2W5T4B0_9BACT|nr:MAG: hypothetical protein DI536_29400 [Archangium gephyra]
MPASVMTPVPPPVAVPPPVSPPPVAEPPPVALPPPVPPSTHAPSTQVAFTLHILQALPSMPHTLCTLPLKQAPSLSQQPGQFDAEQSTFIGLQPTIDRLSNTHIHFVFMRDVLLNARTFQPLASSSLHAPRSLGGCGDVFPLLQQDGDPRRLERVSDAGRHFEVRRLRRRERRQTLRAQRHVGDERRRARG